MTNKHKMYGNVPSNKPSVKTITMGTTEHIVVTPHEYQKFQREFSQLKSQVKQQQAEINNLRSQIRQIANKKTQLIPQQSPWGKWNGGNDGY